MADKNRKLKLGVFLYPFNAIRQGIVLKPVPRLPIGTRYPSLQAAPAALQ